MTNINLNKHLLVKARAEIRATKKENLQEQNKMKNKRLLLI